MQVSFKGRLTGVQVGEAWPRHDGLPQRVDQLMQQPPDAGLGLAA
jgi:hypothetical protein